MIGGARLQAKHPSDRGVVPVARQGLTRSLRHAGRSRGRRDRRSDEVHRGRLRPERPPVPAGLDGELSHRGPAPDRPLHVRQTSSTRTATSSRPACPRAPRTLATGRPGCCRPPGGVSPDQSLIDGMDVLLEALMRFEPDFDVETFDPVADRNLLAVAHRAARRAHRGPLGVPGTRAASC